MKIWFCILLLSCCAVAQIYNPGGGSASSVPISGVTGGTQGEGVVATSPTAFQASLGLGIDALAFTGATNNDYCDKVAAAWLAITTATPNKLQKVFAYANADQHCTWATANAMLANCVGQFDMGGTRIYFDPVAGAPAFALPNTCKWTGLERNGTANGSSINVCTGAGAPAGLTGGTCAAPTYCTAASTPVAGCGFNEGGVEQGGTGAGVARSFNISKISVITTTHTSYLELFLSSITPTSTSFSIQTEELVEIAKSSNPNDNVPAVACQAAGSPVYPECPSSPVYCTGAGAPNADCTGANTAIVWVANPWGATACAASCGELIAGTPEAYYTDSTNPFNGPTTLSTFGQGWQQLVFNGSGIPGIEGIGNRTAQELSWCDSLQFTGFAFAAIDLYSTKTQNFGPCRHITASTGSSVTYVTPATVAVRLGYYIRGLDDFTFTNDQPSFTCNSGVTATWSGGIVTVTYGAGTCNPIVHMDVVVAGDSEGSPINGNYYICGPTDNAGCSTPTSTTFTFLLAGSGTPTGTISVTTEGVTAILADGQQLISGGTISHCEGWSYCVVIGANSPSQGSSLASIVGQNATTGTGVAPVYISNEFATTSSFTQAYNIFGVKTSTAKVLGSVWDQINHPTLLNTDKSLAFYVCDTGTNNSDISCLTSSSIYTSFLAHGESFGSSNQAVIDSSGNVTTGNLGIGSNYQTFSCVNSGSTGTTLNTITKYNNSNPVNCRIAATTDTSGMLGITVAGAGTSGTATLAYEGKIPCVFDGATTAGDFVQISPTVAGNCHDAGATPPTTGQVVGQVQTSNGGGGTFNIEVGMNTAGGAGFTNPMTTLGDVLYGGAAGVATRLAGPIATNNVAQFFTETPSGGAAPAPVWSVAGVVPRASTCGGNTDTILATDRQKYVTESDASACAVTLPQAGTTGFASNFVYKTCNIGAGTVTITPTTSTISYTTGSAYTSGASSLALTTGQCATIFSDNTNYFANQFNGGTGTVTSIATTSPLGGGTITTTGTLTCTTCTTNAGAATSNHVMVGGGSQAIAAATNTTDDNTTFTTTDTGGIKSPVFTATGTTAGFADFAQGTTSSAVAPCNTATSICVQAPAAVTSYLLTMPGAAPAVNNSLKTTSTAGVEAYVATIPAASDPNAGIRNFNQAAQSQVVVSATEYYITRSDLDMPAVYNTAIAAGTTMHWRIALTKTNAGTGTFQILLKKGTNGTTGDTSIVTQTIGTQSAAVDNMEADIRLTWTSSTAAYWTIIPRQSAASGTGFGLVYPAAAAQFTGTISGQTTTTASDKYGLSVIFTTGTPTFVVNNVDAQAYGVN